MKVDEFMRSRGFSNQTGHVREAQRAQFSQRLSELPDIRKIAEIGFNAGHSAECFFDNCPRLEGFLSFDINMFPYTKPAAEYFQNLYNNRFLFVEGDSLTKVPEFARHFPTQKFDLIFIDADHSFGYVLGDILHSKALAHEKTLLWLDDYHFEGVKQAIQFCEAIGMIRIREIFPCSEKCVWVEAEYI